MMTKKGGVCSIRHLRFKEYRVGDTRVLTPVRPLIHTYIVELCRGNDFMIFSNQQDLQGLGKLWSVAARSRGSLIYLPTGKNPLTPYLVNDWHGRGLDLVLLHHHLQFPVKKWKVIRSNMKNGKRLSIESESVKADINRYMNLTGQDYERLWNEYPHDRLHVAKRFETLFLMGSSRVFRYMIGSFIDLSRTGPRISVPGRYHDHNHLDSFLKRNDKVAEDTSLTVDYYDQKTWGS